MDLVSKIVLLESEYFLNASFTSEKNFKVRQHIQSILLLKQKNSRQVELAEYFRSSSFFIKTLDQALEAKVKD